MAIISDLPDENENSTAPSSTNGEEDVLSSLLAKKGPLSLLETVFDLIRRRSDLFKDPAAVSKITELAAAAKAKVDAQLAADRKEEDLVKAKAAEKEKKSVEKPREVDTVIKEEEESSSKKAKVEQPEDDDGKSGMS